MSFSSSYYESDQEIPWSFVSDLHKDTYNGDELTIRKLCQTILFEKDVTDTNQVERRRNKLQT
jgi:hypothetical protein